MINCFGAVFPSVFDEEGVDYLELEWGDGRIGFIDQLSSDLGMEVYRFVSEAISRNNCILIHCQAPYHRSIVLAIFILHKR